MAVYKVPQDVEAEDKLIGPFSFRQFIYLIVAALGIFMAWLLAQIFIGLLVIPLPIIVTFLALALPLRKDQPMETYLIAMLKFFFKPRHRIWDPEGTISLVQITAPKVADGPQLKEFGGSEASQRLAYLAQVVDTQGWATRGAMSASDSLSDIFVAEASHAEDILDASSGVAQAIDQRITQTDDARLSAVRQQFQAAIQQPQHPQQPPQLPPEPQQLAAPQVADDSSLPQDIHYNPYPNAMRQHVINPAGVQQPDAPQPVVQTASQAQAEKQPGSETVSPDIMRLANNNDLSISALSREAHRLENDDKEVVISLR
jgi:hypothetical protein